MDAIGSICLIAIAAGIARPSLADITPPTSKQPLVLPSDDRPPIVTTPDTKSTGIYLDYQPDVTWFYDTFFTVVFEVDVPRWNASSLRMELAKNLSKASELVSCSDIKNDTEYWASTLCPTTKKFFGILEDFAKQLEIFENMNASFTRLDSYLESCHDIKPHFSNHIIDEVEIDLYLLEVIMNCPITDILHKRINITRPNRTRYADILQLFVDTYISPKFRIMGYAKYAIATNTLLGLHTTQLLDYFIDTFQWTTARGECNTQRIPKIFIPPDQMQKTLEEVERKVKDKGYRLTVPIQDLSNYYKLKIADCIMTSAKSFVIRMLVPLTLISANYQMVEVKLTPFLDQVGLSDKNDQLFCRRRVEEGMYIIDGTSKAPIAMTSCDPEQLCRVPQEGERKVFNLCSHAALQNDTSIILKYCHLSCMRVQSTSFPHITRVRGDQLVITGSSSAEITVQCRGFEGPLKILEPPKYGSMLITLPCGCYLSHRATEVDIDHGSCARKLEITHIIPFGTTESAISKFYHNAVMRFTEQLSKINETVSNKLMWDSDDGTTQEVEDNEVNKTEEQSSGAIWFAYILIVTLILGLVCLGYVARNLYVRVGQLEVSTAMVETRTSNYLARSHYNRETSVSFNARAVSNNHPRVISSGTEDTVF